MSKVEKDDLTRKRGGAGEYPRGAVKALWKGKPLGEVLQLEYGKPLDDADRKPDGLYPVYGANGEKDRSDKFYFDKPSIIVGRKGSAGEVNLTEEKFWPLDVTYFVTFDERQYELRFLYYLLTTLDLPSLAKGVKPGINRNEVYSQIAKVPPLLEQQRIVGILDKAFDGIATAKANAKKNLQNTRALFESHLQSVLTQRGEGWVEKPLAELCDPKRVITYGVIKLGDEVPDGIPCLRTSNVRWLRIETEGMKRIAPTLSSEYSRTILKGGEVLVNVRGTLGGVAVAAREMAGWNVSREVAVVPVDPSRVNPVFLSYLIGSGVSQQWLGDVKKGAAYVGINIEDLRLLPVSAPEINKQLKVVRHLELLQHETCRLESFYQRKLAALEELKKSLLHQAFSGRL